MTAPTLTFAGTRIVHFPGSVRVMLDNETVRSLADMVEGHVGAFPPDSEDAHYIGLLAEALRGSDGVNITIENHNDGRDDTRTTDYCAALVGALVDAGASA
jgi:hypothetical protein